MQKTYESVYAELKKVLLGNDIQTKQYDFICQHQDQFSPEEENKHEYYDIFKKFQKLMEQEIDIQLQKNNLDWSQVEEVLAENAEKVAKDDLFQIIELFSDFETFKEGMLGLDKEQGPMGIAIFMANKGYFQSEQQNFEQKKVAATLTEEKMNGYFKRVEEVEKRGFEILPLDDKWKQEVNKDGLLVHTLKNVDESGIFTVRIQIKLKGYPDQIKRVSTTPNEKVFQARDKNIARFARVEDVNEDTFFSYFLTRDFVIVSAREAFIFANFAKYKNGFRSCIIDIPQGEHPKDTVHTGIRGKFHIWFTCCTPDPKNSSYCDLIQIRQYNMNGLVPIWLMNKIGIGSGKLLKKGYEKVMKEFNIV